MELDTKTYWLTERQSQSDSDFESLEVAAEMIQKKWQ
jgi:hypothetical protein